MIQTTEVSITYKGDGVQTSFPYPYPYRNSDDIVGIVAHLLAGDMVVVEGALGLYAVVNISRHLELAQEV